VGACGTARLLREAGAAGERVQDGRGVGSGTHVQVKLLLDSRQDLLELQTAAGENMPDQCGEANGATRLQAVMDALITLGYKSE